MEKKVDVAIVGASLAGSSLAIRLANLGISTAVVDKSAFPRRKACGEGLSDVAVGILQSLGLGPALENTEHHPFHGYQAWLGNFSVDIACRPPFRGKPKGIGIQRYLLDELLLKKVSNHQHVDLYLGKKVRRVERDGEQHILEIDNHTTISAKYLVLADGANSILAPRLGVPCKKDKVPRWGLSWIYEGQFSQPVHRVAIVIKNGYEIYCTPVSENRVNVCFLSRKEFISELSDSDRSKLEIAQALEKIHFRGAAASKPVNIGPIAASRRPVHHGSVLLVGDACESLDPISGMGMTHALITSMLAAEALNSVINLSVPRDTAFAELAKKREAAVRPYRGFTRLTGILLRGTRNHERVLAALAKTPFPLHIRNALSVDPLEGSAASAFASAILTVAGL